MTEWIVKMIESKRLKRGELANLPFDQKIDILERLRERSSLIADSDLARKYKGVSTFPKP